MLDILSIKPFIPIKGGFAFTGSVTSVDMIASRERSMQKSDCASPSISFVNDDRVQLQQHDRAQWRIENAISEEGSQDGQTEISA